VGKARGLAAALIAVGGPRAVSLTCRAEPFETEFIQPQQVFYWFRPFFRPSQGGSSPPLKTPARGCTGRTLKALPQDGQNPDSSSLQSG
jgi:hypothetical protein